MMTQQKRYWLRTVHFTSHTSLDQIYHLPTHAAFGLFPSFHLEVGNAVVPTETMIWSASLTASINASSNTRAFACSILLHPRSSSKLLSGLLFIWPRRVYLLRVIAWTSYIPLLFRNAHACWPNPPVAPNTVTFGLVEAAFFRKFTPDTLLMNVAAIKTTRTWTKSLLVLFITF